MPRLETIEEKVKNAIKDQFAFDKEEVYRTDRLDEDLGMDSVDKVEMIMALEDELQIEINDEDTENWKTVQDVIDFGKKKGRKKKKA